MTALNQIKRKIVAVGLVFLFITLSFGPLASAGALNRFELKDGSVIQGKILSYRKGVYKINSDVLGTIALPESKIRAIQPASASGNKTPPPSPPSAHNLDKIQQQMMNDPETVQLIQQLENNPSVQEILQDKELMDAIARGNLDRVGADPKIKALMRQETVGKIIKKNQ
jgi:hypothetical protein